MDDLDAFFDEVEEAEEEAKKEQQQEQQSNEEQPSKNENVNHNANTHKHDNDNDNDNNDDQPPSKNSKVVVASSVPTVVASMVAVSAPPVRNIIEPQEPIIHHLVPPGTIPPHLSRSALHSAGDVSLTQGGGCNVGIVPPPPPPSFENSSKKVMKRTAAGKTWEDPTLVQWPKNDFRLFVGNLAKDVHTTQLEEVFRNKYSSFAMARVVYNKADNKSKGYGFVSFLDPRDAAKAIREMNDSFLGNRPIKVKRGEWKERDLSQVKKRKKNEKKLKKKLGLA
mmetsp:Transcript_15487/g.20172  ORF Transcript_15487/g.20172 Transcript_15487/m.20172 type:complete len:280 (-) Transcript_15487:1819-2658(-)|eukprot:CAMPEP_0116063664 /NCGR_PEP_ID=MMETSP0322-20121206/8567_1 /TAXON_ID=163516 /ORGANISM="Leptocylindrus danicus var. apora, Strain B651" /LENGTH=279 /DNA_ID=CAMNT_0003549361 /DNA_START=71 /DNA_END=910 /DNA_ORIENTATION=-